MKRPIGTGLTAALLEGFAAEPQGTQRLSLLEANPRLTSHYAAA
jgi:hypothetical protein